MPLTYYAMSDPPFRYSLHFAYTTLQSTSLHEGIYMGIYIGIYMAKAEEMSFL